MQVIVNLVWLVITIMVVHVFNVIILAQYVHQQLVQIVMMDTFCHQINVINVTKIV